MRVPYCGSDDGTHRTMRRTGRDEGVLGVIAIVSYNSPFPRGTEMKVAG